ncbi:hypothetical protein G9A89_012565 [Geosiphon pyriformis]|nr:hypothetical protein G9A89_012565 [Geosiphon pyriformis]
MRFFNFFLVSIFLFSLLTLVINAAPLSKRKFHKKPSVNKAGDGNVGGNTGTEKHSGQGTYFNPGLGACGAVDNDNSQMVALGSPFFDQYTPNGNPNHNSLCGKQIRIYFEGKSVDGIIHDRCPECAAGDVDMSPFMFNQIADQSRGRINIEWEILNA